MHENLINKMPRSLSYSRSSSRSKEFLRKANRSSNSRNRSIERGRERDKRRSRSGSRGRNDRKRRSPSRERSSKRNNTSRCLGVFGLSFFTKEYQIRDIFSKYGNLESVILIRDTKTNRSRGYCFIYFENHDDAKAALDGCDGMIIDDRKVRVDFSLSEKPHPPTPGVYLGKNRFNDFDRDRYHNRRDDRFNNRERYDRRPRSPSPYYRERRNNYRSRSRSYSPRESK